MQFLPTRDGLIDADTIPSARQRNIKWKWTTPLGVFVAVWAMLFTLSGWAQTKEHSTESIEGLRHATDLANSAADFFVGESAVKTFPNAPANKNHITPSEQQFAESYVKMKEATSLFLKYADPPLVSAAVDKAGDAFKMRGFPRPRMLLEAVEQCAKLRNLDLSWAVANSLRGSMYQAWQGQAATAKFGTIVDNPAFYMDVKLPTSAKEVLRNVKWALDHDALLRVDFFTPESMDRFFGVAAPMIRSLDGIRANGEMEFSLKGLTDLPKNFAVNAKCTYSVGGALESDGSLKEGSLAFFCNYITFDDVELVFGDKWQAGWMVFGPPPPHSLPFPATAPHGNETMVYDFDGPPYYRGRQVQRRLVVEFAPDASLKALQLSEGF
jgi:hypothetical protein